MKFNINKYLALGAIGLSSVFFVSCDESSSGGNNGGSSGEPAMTFPKELQGGDEIVFDGSAVNVWTFSGPETFDWSGTENTISRYKSNTWDYTVLIDDAGIDQEGAEVVFQERIDELLEDFDSILRTIPLARVQAGEELTVEDLRAFEELINAEVVEDGKVIVVLDEENVRLILSLTYDMTLLVTSGLDSFNEGLYSGSYTATNRGAVIDFKAPTSSERESYRLTSDHRLPRVMGSLATLPELIMGEFVWTLSSSAPPEEVVEEDVVE